MKSRLIFITSAIALILTLGLFSISVFAALSQNFGVNNRIVFVGESLVSFNINGEITGTTIDGDDSLKYNWSYSNENDMPTDDAWDLADNLVFDEKGKVIDSTSVNRVSITYTFEIENLSDAKNLIVYIEEPNGLDRSILTTNIVGSVGNEIVISPETKGTVSLEVIPLEKFQGSKACNFNIHISSED